MQRLGTETDPRWVRLAALQNEVRPRAREKHPRGDELYWTREAFEQATPHPLAQWHAALFPAGVPVTDITLGIGIDALARAEVSPVIGYERDPDRGTLARWNAEVLGLPLTVMEGDAMESQWQTEYVFADPARRESGQRSTRLEGLSPDPREIAERMRAQRGGAIKLSPMMPDAELESLGGQIRWLSSGGSCREALIAIGETTLSAAARAAIHVESGEELAPDMESAPRMDLPQEGDTLYEADPGAIRAGGLPTLAQRHGLKLLGDSNGYLVGPAGVTSPWLKPYPVRASGAFRPKRVNEALRSLGASTPVLKQRHCGLDLIALERQVKQSGDKRVAVAIYRVGAAIKFAILSLD